MIVHIKSKTIVSLRERCVLSGEVVDDAESKRRMAEAKASGEHNFYMMEMAPGLIIDARTKWAPAPARVHAVLACACLGVSP